MYQEITICCEHLDQEKDPKRWEITNNLFWRILEQGDTVVLTRLGRPVKKYWYGKDGLVTANILTH